VGLAVAAVVGVLAVRHAVKAQSQKHAWALLVVSALLVSPHLFAYDLALLLLPALLLLGERWSRTTVRAIVATSVMVWLSPLRGQLFGASPWPGSILAAPLAVIPLVFLWREIARRCEPEPKLARDRILAGVLA
jgi:hypothetical protein